MSLRTVPKTTVGSFCGRELKKFKERVLKRILSRMLSAKRCWRKGLRNEMLAKVLLALRVWAVGQGA